jgi:hypothetical protein
VLEVVGQVASFLPCGNGISIIATVTPAARHGVMGQLRLAKDILGKKFELRKAFAASRPVQRGPAIILYLSIVAGSNHNETILAREDLVGNNRGICCATVAQKTVPMFGCFGKTDLWKI